MVSSTLADKGAMTTNQILRDFDRSMQRRNLRPRTIDKRMREVRAWLTFAGDAWQTCDRELIETWLDGRPLGASARYCAISHLHRFYLWCEREGLVSRVPTTGIDRPRLPRRLPRPAKRQAVDQAILVAPWTLAVMLALMADAGLRCCEVAGLTWDDVDLDVGTMHVVGKGGHERVVGIPERLERILAASDDVVGFVVGRRMTPTRVSQITNQYLRSVGISSTAHQLRHLYATRLLAATGRIDVVQQALGHASISTTQGYARVAPDLAVTAARALA